MNVTSVSKSNHVNVDGESNDLGTATVVYIKNADSTAVMRSKESVSLEQRYDAITDILC